MSSWLCFPILVFCRCGTFNRSLRFALALWLPSPTTHLDLVPATATYQPYSSGSNPMSSWLCFLSPFRSSSFVTMVLSIDHYVFALALWLPSPTTHLDLVPATATYQPYSSGSNPMSSWLCFLSPFRSSSFVAVVLSIDCCIFALALHFHRPPLSR